MTWRRTELLITTLLLLGVAPAVAQPRPDTGMDAAVDEVLHLQVVLNQAVQPGLLRVIRRDGHFFAAASDMRGMGLRLPGLADAGTVALDALPGAEVRYDRPMQRLRLDVPLAALDLPTTRLGPEGVVATEPSTASPGAVLNYDLYAVGGDARQFSLGTDLRLFGFGGAVLGNTAITSTTRTGQGDWSTRTVRLDTQVEWAFPRSAVSVVAGDAYTGSLGWTRTLRVGGVRIGRNFGLQPYRITSPLASFAGEAVVPSAVELYIDGVRQSSHQVPSGPFQITTVPAITGAGMAQVVMTDAFGRSRTLDFPFYASQQLLARGLSDWSVGLGAVREDYGRRSFAYADEAVGSASIRYGVSDRFTAEAHAEGTSGLALAGAGGTWLLGRAGVVGTSLARSSLGGTQAGLAYQWTDGRFTVSFDSLRNRGDYSDVASLYGAPPPRTSERALLGYASPRLGSASLSHVRLTHRDGQPASRLLGVFWNRAFDGWWMHLSWNRSLVGPEPDHVGLGILVPLGPRQLGAAWQRQGGRDVLVVDALQPTPAEGGLGWRLQGRSGAGGGGVAEAGWLGDRGRLAVGASHLSGQTLAYAQLDGSLVAMGGGAFLARDIVDGFAIVSTDGIAGVPVRRENRLVGHTGRDGLLLVTGLNAWQRNRLSIDPMDLPADLHVPRVDLEATPAARAGTIARFAIQPLRAALIVLHDGAGTPLPLGSRVSVDGAAGAQAFVGHDGETYLEALGTRNRLRISGEAGDCTIEFPYPAVKAGSIPRIGPLTCRPESSP